ncbi:hypothetical protein [Cardiobacterium valvarum]|uniref:DUF4340 domain-containing protein n=1 Tax=Cardiobacterium valvarum F0432 TaxID=797473 RepID=G9ZD20_9GAMM|nr:hypothetical protein [Cardiobacterium valvarum]EHM55564.1 hypothetical protein HMPREF9080_00653 [Cardiobacterium valvarum F0432]
MATQTSLRLSALALWGALLALFLALNARLGRVEHFLDPARVQHIRINYSDSRIDLNRDGAGWVGDGKRVRDGRTEQMLDILASCHNPQPLAAIQAAPSRPVTLGINGKTYTLGAYNSFHHAHYLDDGTTAWLCNENLKAMLAQPPASWFPKLTPDHA